MNYRKFRADYLFTGRTLLDNSVLITAPDGEVIAVVSEKEAGGDIENFSGIITPGFINTHCHLELSHTRGLVPQNTGLVDFVYKIVSGRHFPEQDILTAIDTAEQYMLAHGIVAVGDICNNTLTLTQKVRRNLVYYNFIEASGWAPSLAEARWRRSKDIFELFLAKGLTASIVPHAPYSVSGDLWRYISAFSQNRTLSIHNQESVFEDELFMQGTGDFIRMYGMMNIDNPTFSPSKKTSLQTYHSRLSEAASVIFVHNTYTTQADISFVKQNTPPHQRVSFCLCANANMYIENKMPPVEMLLANDCSLTLGTDSLASNFTLDILEEIKTIQNNFPGVPLAKMLQWATINGANALQMENVYGSLDKGKRPGIVLISGMEGQMLTKNSTSARIL